MDKFMAIADVLSYSAVMLSIAWGVVICSWHGSRILKKKSENYIKIDDD
jgi:hypothetical protein